MDADTAESQQIKKTWKPIAAGILDIIIGCQCLAGGLGLFIAGIACSSFAREYGAYSYSSSALIFMSAIALPLLIVGVLAIRGGIYALKRRRWGFSLAGPIAAILTLFILWIATITAPMLDFQILVRLVAPPLFYLLLLLSGIAAIVFTVLAKKEFE